MFQHFSAFIECSTGSTPTVETVKSFIRMLSKMGYNELYLGCTDGYKIEGEPYFNYKRGGYTTADFREMDACAKENGIELIANIQTLGHLDFLKRHYSYRDLMDNDSCLMVGDERVYALVEKMFGAISAGLSSRRIHIGFDECWGLGQGNYQLKNGPADAKALLLQHLKRVVKIAQKYGYSCEIWHDMLTDRKNTTVTAADVKAALPEDVTVFYWDYFENDKDALRRKIDTLKQYVSAPWYAGSAFKCGSMAPLNGYSIDRILHQMQVAAEKEMPGYMVTLWSDNGAWVNNYTVLPTLFAAAEYNRGAWNGVGAPDKARFREIVGCDYDAMMAFDYLDDPLRRAPVDSHCNRSFQIMLSDVLNGGWDLLYSPETTAGYERLAEEFAGYLRSDACGPFRLLFRTAEKFARVLARKALLGVELRDAYKKRDKAAVRVSLDRLAVLKAALAEYIDIYEDCWLHDNMAFGLEIDQMFLGSMQVRLTYIEKRLRAFLEEDVLLPELEAETVRPDVGPDGNEDSVWDAGWKNIISNVGIF